MPHHFSRSTLAAALTVSLFSISQPNVSAAPGNLGQVPLFVAPPTRPNIFFMLDDSGSMHWAMPSDGVQSSSLINYWVYDTVPDYQKEWNIWCPGANLMAYNPNVEYKPWSANIPGTNTPFPDQTDITKVRTNPLASGPTYTTENNYNIQGNTTRTINLSAAPVVTWTDNDNDGQYDNGECPTGNATTGYQDSRVIRADQLSPAQQTNFANWFSYYRIREHATKAAVTQVVANTSARMGMATLHHNNEVGVAIKDMTDAGNKKKLLKNVVQVDSSGGTPLRRSLYRVGQYFDKSSSTPSGLHIGSPPSPILSAADGGECQQNFVMLMTDGQWNGSFSSVDHQDKDLNKPYVFQAHRDNNKNILGDIAMKWYKTDLAPNLANKVPIQTGGNTQNLDENNQQHLVTFGVAFGPSGTLSAGPTDRTQAFNWPTPSSNASTTVDDLRHAAYNGRGKFLSANNPQTLITALQDVISDIESRQGSAAAVAFNSTTLSSDTALFFATFDTTSWKGNLAAYMIDPVTGNLANSPDWNASAVLDSKSNSNMLNNRLVYTWGLDASTNENGVLFNWSTTNPNPKTNILDDLKQNQDGSTDTSPFTESQNRLNFLLGDISLDGSGLIRNRSSRLGDIIHSAPIYVGPPNSNWPDASPFGNGNYSQYQSNLLSTPREPVVYVGANDGLLHGFRASDGEEIFAYLPTPPTSTNDNAGLHYLSESDYGHRYYVDGSPISADIYFDPSASGAPSWQTVLVGALRGGGQGLYALNINDPAQFQKSQTAAKNSVLWEFTNQDDADLGFTFSTPQITMMNNGKWAVILGNGYNASGTNTAKLMIIYIEGGLDGQWTLSTDYIKIDTLAGNGVNKNGLSTPTLVDLDGNGTTDRVYAGDLLGNMWSFDVSDTNSSNWDIAHKDNTSNPVPLFAAGNTQAITMKPLVIKNNWVTDSNNNKPNLMVYFGTGQYIAIGDASTTDQQSFYGIWDTGLPVVKSNLIEQTFVNVSASDARVLTENAVDYASTPANGNLGWFINLPESGERVIVEAFELQGLIYFNTMTPSSAPCSAGGNSWLMAVDKKTGGNPGINAFDYNDDGALNDSDKVADASNNQVIVAGVQFNYGIASKTAVISTRTGKSFGYTSGTNSMTPIKTVLPGAATGKRKSWIQLFN